MLRDDPARFSRIYRVLLEAAQAVGFGTDRLPDFLGLDSTSAERLDPRNGLAACPAHDVAFDTGKITVNG